MDLYLKTSQEISALLTTRYSTSFSWGIKVFPLDVRRAIFSIYGFVRIADEIVDTFLLSDKKSVLEDFKKDTYAAIENKISTNPVLHAFQDVVCAYNIDHEYIEAFLCSMEMDLDKLAYTPELYKKYIYGSAEVVGLMCLKVFCLGYPQLFETLKPFAMKLGSAYQKVNFLRDIKADVETRGRIYFPQLKRKEDLTDDIKKILERDIRTELSDALKGIKRLPRNCQLANYSVFLYYQELLQAIERSSARDLLKKRMRVPDLKKVMLLLKAFWTIKVLWRN